jgi:hypothetical protein
MLKESAQLLIQNSLGGLKTPVRLVLFTSDTNCDGCPDALETARAIKAAAPKVALETYDVVMDRDKSLDYGVTRVPCFVVEGHDRRRVAFSGSMEGLSLVLLVDAIVGIASAKKWFPEQITGTLQLLQKDVPVQVVIENDCSLCKPVVETAVALALSNRLVSMEIIVADDFPEFLAKHRIKILPYTLFGPKLHLEGHVSESMFLEMLLEAEGQRREGTDKRCVVCGNPSPELICQSCKSKIQAEAMDHKSKDEHLHEKGTVVRERGHDRS